MKQARKAIEATYSGYATVVVHQKVTDEKTHLTGYQDVTVLEKQPCRLSFESITTTSQQDAAAEVAQSIKLFIAPEIVIQENSKVIIEQNGRVGEYTNSGVAAVYPTHQEIMLKLFERWA